jgi:hypothetical protein
MNKRICSAAILLLVAISCFKADAQQIYMGAKAGVNLANQSQDPTETGVSRSERTGILAGVQLDYCFDKVWSLSAQVLYDQKGTNSSNTLDTENLLYNYLEIPILLKASITIGNFSPYIFAGPSVGCFLSGNGTLKGTFTTENSPTPQTGDTTFAINRSSVNSLDVAAVIGAGVSLKLDSGPMLSLDAAYAYGLVNIANNSFNDNVTLNSRDIRLAAGILFPLN